MSKCETSFKVGDKVKLVKAKYPDGLANGIFYDCKEGDELVIKKLHDNVDGEWTDGSGVFSVNKSEYFVTGSMLELIEDVIPTPKSLLKDYMRVIDLRGIIWIVAQDCIYLKEGFDRLQEYDDNLFNESCPELSIQAIYKQPDGEWSLLNFEKLGELVWQRESKEELEKKAQREALKASMKVMQAELETMKKKLEEMK